MSFRFKPSEPNHDDMANNWGIGLIEPVKGSDVPPRRLDSEIRKVIPGFRLMSLVESGTTANERAISIATLANFDRCLIAMGSYAGGVGVLEKLSSSVALSNWQLSLVKDPEHCSDQAKQQTVAFPYHIPNSKLSDLQLAQYEDNCLKALEAKLIKARLCGKGYKSLLMEYILSGTGGVLSDAFLIKLAGILKRFHVSIIIDEIMTGGRVGPTMAMTMSLPIEFTACITFMMLGKIMGCGLVLEKISTFEEHKGRGTSTELQVGEAYEKFTCIQERIVLGYIGKKRQKVLAALKMDNNEDDNWGQGLMMFTSKSRSAVQRNLKNRLLPMLEMGKKTKLQLGVKDTCWNRISVNKHLMKSARRWIEYGKATENARFDSPYIVRLASFIADNPTEETIFPAQLMDYIGSESEQLVDEYRLKKKQKLGTALGRSKKSHKSLVYAAFKDAANMSSGFISPKAKLQKRLLAYVVNYDVE